MATGKGAVQDGPKIQGQTAETAAVPDGVYKHYHWIRCYGQGLEHKVSILHAMEAQAKRRRVWQQGAAKQSRSSTDGWPLGPVLLWMMRSECCARDGRTVISRGS